MAKSTLNIKPLAGYVVIEPLEAEEITASGIYLPDSAKEKPAQGKVIEVGAPLVKKGYEVKPEFKKGDTVLYKKWGGDEIKIEGKEFKIVKFEDVMAILQ